MTSTSRPSSSVFAATKCAASFSGSRRRTSSAISCRLRDSVANLPRLPEFNNSASELATMSFILPPGTPRRPCISYRPGRARDRHRMTRSHDCGRHDCTCKPRLLSQKLRCDLRIGLSSRKTGNSLAGTNFQVLHEHLRQPQQAPAGRLRAVCGPGERPGGGSQGAGRRRAQGQDRGIQGPAPKGRGPRLAGARGVRGGSGSRRAHGRHAPLRRATGGRGGASPGQDRRDAHRRGQDAGGDAQRLPQRAVRQGRAHRYRERLPCPAGRGLDGSHLRVPWVDGGRRQGRPEPRRQAGSLPGRHHLRYQQRIRFRLPAGQSRHPLGGPGAAGTELRHRRRGGLHSHRRGEDAPDHLGAVHGEHRALPQDQQAHPQADPPSSAGWQGQREYRGQAGGRRRRIRRGSRGNAH